MSEDLRNVNYVLYDQETGAVRARGVCAAYAVEAQAILEGTATVAVPAEVIADGVVDMAAPELSYLTLDASRAPNPDGSN